MTDEVNSGEAGIWNPRKLLSLSSDTKRIEESQVATEGQATFSLSTFVYAVGTGSLAVFKNGLFQSLGTDWTEATENSFNLTIAATAGDVVSAVGFVAITGDAGGGGGAYMPLAGGTWDEDATQTFPKPAASAQAGAVFGLTGLLGVTTFVWGATTEGDNEVGYNFITDDEGVLGTGANLVGNKTNGWAISNQVFNSDNSVITKGYADANYGGGTGMPTSGGVWLQDATQTFTRSAASTGANGFFEFHDSILGKSSFEWGSTNSGDGEVSHIWNTDDQGLLGDRPTMILDADDGLIIGNQKFSNTDNVSTVAHVTSEIDQNNQRRSWKDPIAMGTIQTNGVSAPIEVGTVVGCVVTARDTPVIGTFKVTIPQAATGGQDNLYVQVSQGGALGGAHVLSSVTSATTFEVGCYLTTDGTTSVDTVVNFMVYDKGAAI